MGREDYAKQLAYQRAWYSNNRSKVVRWVAARKVRTCLMIADLKALTACLRCGERDPRCLQFHHSRGSRKDFDMANAAWLGNSLERIFSEIEKCEILCANCHLKEHR